MYIFPLHILFVALVSHFPDRVSEYLYFCWKPIFSSRGFIRWLLSTRKRCVMFKQWRIQANIRLRNVSSLVCGFMKKNELVERTKKSEKTSLFVQWSSSQWSQSPRSLDLTTCDNWLCSYLKENVSIIIIDSFENWRERSSVSSERSLP